MLKVLKMISIDEIMHIVHSDQLNLASHSAFGSFYRQMAEITWKSTPKGNKGGIYPSQNKKLTWYTTYIY